MRPRLGPLAVLLLVLLAAAPAARAATKPPTVKVAACDTKAQSATFRATMRTVPDSARMAVRFTLQARSDEQPAWAPVTAPGFDTWLSSRRGRAGFTYDKTVQALPAPGEYRVLVRYRWRDAANTTIAHTRRTSKACVQPDPRPDLQPTDLAAVGGGFQLTVANAGGGAAPAFAVRLDTGAATVTQMLPGLATGQSTKVRFDSLTCAPGSTLVATVDPAGLVDEADEAGNVLAVPCPS